MEKVPYARVLGFRENSSSLLKSIKENSKIPLILVAADAKEFLADSSIPENAKQLLRLDITASRIYNSVIQNRYGTTLNDEFGGPLLKI